MKMRILDDFGIQPFDHQSRSSLMEIIEDRHGKRSTIITSQLPIKGWYEEKGEQTIADAILDKWASIYAQNQKTKAVKTTATIPNNNISESEDELPPESETNLPVTTLLGILQSTTPRGFE